MIKFKKLNKFTYIILISTFVLLLGITVAVSYFAANNKSFTKEQKDMIDIDKYVTGCAKNDKFNGSILVAQNGEILLYKAFGLADKANEVKITTETKFLIGSVTKQFTAVAIMQLQEKGLLNVDDTINKYIPDISHGDNITIHELLTHTSGLPADFVDIGKFNSLPLTLDDAIHKIKGMNIQLLSNPGVSFNYSSFGYMLLSYIIEITSRKSYEDYINKNIFIPLEMNSSGFGYNRNVNSDLAFGYDASGKLVPSELNENEAKLLSGAGEIYSTVEDLYKWDRALYTQKLLSKKSIEQIYTPYSDNYGYGSHIVSTSPKEIYDHSGSMTGFSSCITRLVGFNSFIIVLSNNPN